MTRKSPKLSLLTRKAEGFTLIELLIVIVIIGILAGVLIAVIDPAAQQNRARDANVKAAMNKVGLSAQGFISSYGYAPNAVEFDGAIQNDTPVTCTDASANTEGSTCTFTLTGITYQDTCVTATPYMPGGTSPCVLMYERTDVGATASTTETNFVVRAPSFGIASTWFELRNYVDGALPASTILHCTSSGCVVPTN